MSGPGELPVPPRPPVAVKGRGRELRIAVVRDAPPDELAASLREQLARRAGAFFVGATVTIELLGDDLDLGLAARLGSVVAEAGMRVSAVVAAEGGPPAAAPAAASPDRDRGDAATNPGAGGALVVARSLRGGQRVAHDGDVVVLGDVNPGAEVVAGGHVVVWGRLRGIVEAGRAIADASVCALDLAPTQLRIGSAIARAPEDPERVPVPEVARAADGRIMVEPWRPGA